MRKDAAHGRRPSCPPTPTGARNPSSRASSPHRRAPAATILLLRRGGKHADRELEVLMVKRNRGARFMPGVWVFPGGARRGRRADHGRQRGRDRRRRRRAGPPRRGDPRAGTRRPASSSRPTPSCCRGRAGSRPSRYRSASTPASTSPWPQRTPRPEPDGSETTDAAWMNPAGRPRARPGRRDRAGLSHDQAPRVAAPVRDLGGGDGSRARAGGRADHADDRRRPTQSRAGGCSCPATRATSRRRSEGRTRPGNGSRPACHGPAG